VPYGWRAASRFCATTVGDDDPVSLKWLNSLWLNMREANSAWSEPYLVHSSHTWVCACVVAAYGVAPLHACVLPGRILSCCCSMAMVAEVVMYASLTVFCDGQVCVCVRSFLQALVPPVQCRCRLPDVDAKP
jgi:hypothetical protein